MFDIHSAWNFIWPRVYRTGSRDDQMVSQIREQADTLSRLTDSALQERVQDLQNRFSSAHCRLSDDLVMDGFAIVTEATHRVLGWQLYDVQLLTGLSLVRCAIVEMKTGEGKTLVAALPGFMHALGGRGVHVMTVNQYLARRDFQLLAPVFQRLGMSVGLLIGHGSRQEKQRAYACDITYGPGYEFGFDYLRDQLALLQQKSPHPGRAYRDLLRTRVANQAANQESEATVQRGHAFAIIDEVDSVLIDEATTPLVLSEGPAESAQAPELYRAAVALADRLSPETDYDVDKASQQIQLRPQGLGKVDSSAWQLLDSQHGPIRPWPEYVEQALRAKVLLKRDADYVVRDDQIMLVDESTGRIFSDRSWNHGLHQAVQAKEGVPLTAEKRPLARISRQQYFRLYHGLCGMTGTATGCEREFWNFYRLPVVVVPLRVPSQRKHQPTRFFDQETSKWLAIVAEVRRIHASGQPILVGTRTIEDSQLLARLLDSYHLPYRLLNGILDESEAEIVTQAGSVGAVTIATNLAGRGTDIKLGPSADSRGGLHVIGAEPHESSRIDRQLIGRAARQGDPGSCQLFVSADDRLIQTHAPSLCRRMQRMADGQGEIRVDLSQEVAMVQRRVDRIDYVKRCQLFSHDDWLDDVLSKLAKP